LRRNKKVESPASAHEARTGRAAAERCAQGTVRSVSVYQLIYSG
jgi:hypothetical protein